MRDSRESIHFGKASEGEYCKHGNIKGSCVKCLAEDDNIPDLTNSPNLKLIEGDNLETSFDTDEISGIREIKRTGRSEFASLSIESGRHPNEDTILEDRELGIIGVADGMGGEGGKGSGKVASELSMGIIHNELRKIRSDRSVDNVKNAMRKGFESANNTMLGIHDKVKRKVKGWFSGAMGTLRKNGLEDLAGKLESLIVNSGDNIDNADQAIASIQEAAEAGKVQESDLEGAKTTATIIALARGNKGESRAIIGHAGDSRAYKLADSGELEQVTKDHDNLYEAINSGLVDEKDIETLDDSIGRFPKLKALVDANPEIFIKKFGRVPETLKDLKKGTQEAIGKNNIKFDVFDVPAEPGDIFITFSDGVTKNVKNGEIEAIFADREILVSEKIDKVIKLAKRRGVQRGGSNDDDISGVVLEIPLEFNVDLRNIGEETEEELDLSGAEAIEDSKNTKMYRELQERIETAQEIKSEANRKIVLESFSKEQKKLFDKLSDEEIVVLGLETEKIIALYNQSGGDGKYKAEDESEKRIQKLMETIDRKKKLKLLGKINDSEAILSMDLIRDKIKSLDWVMSNIRNYNLRQVAESSRGKVGEANKKRIEILNRQRKYYQQKLVDSEASNEGLSRPSSAPRKKFGEGVFDDNGRLINRD